MDQELYRQHRAAEDSHWWFVARRRIVAAVLQRFFRGGASARVLEVGCGTGGNLAMLSSFGRLDAMELDDGARALANGRGLMAVAAGRLPDSVPFDGGFDLVCALDVIEHVEDDVAALRALRDQLAPGGTLLLTVPAFMFLWSAHDVANHHFRRYTRPQLLERLRAAGLTPVHASYFNTLLFPLILAIRWLHVLLRRPPGSDIDMPSPRVNGWLTRLFGLESGWVAARGLPFGVSVLAVARREG